MSPNLKKENILRLALLISGSGSTMESIIKACQNKTLKNVKPVLVIASTIEAGGIQKAKNLGISPKDILVINPKEFKNREKFGEKVLKECKKRNVNFIGQYGWLVLTPKNVITEYKGHIVNQHPGPLDTGKPDFGGKGMYGIRVHKARLEFIRRVKRDYWTEATCHYVTEKFDEGKVVKRIQMKIEERDSTKKVQMKLLPIEHQTQIEALRDFSEGSVEIFKRKIPLIKSKEEIEILEKCKKIAVKAYPNG
ncbi:MAG: hypothetical protein K9L98_03575 [Candidatus Pacebacteria bacterium]|nr:hypothetical protein [Candidatus Paceibacterota bacterium]MCF7863057.1 hypothetical protein [Candidatus Paceibacterota bacterium]